VQASHEPPSRRPHCSSTQQWVTPELGLSSTPGQGNQTQAEVTGKTITHHPKEGILSQESPTLTAHRPSFPTCLFHSRRVHLLCHLDSPSAASLPYLGLQEQTRPEVSGFCSSYRVPSRSSLLPLRTLSPGGVTHRPTSLTQSSTAWPQQPMGKTDKGFPNQFSSHRMISWSCLQNRDTMHRLAQLFPNKQGFFHSSPTQVPIQEMHSRVLLEPDTDSTVLDRGVPGFFRTNTGPFFSVSKLHDCLLQTGSYDSGSRQSGPLEEEPPSRLILVILSACTRVDTCHPWDCMRSPARVPPTTWEITWPSKRT
jgi:hypothetical protein